MVMWDTELVKMKKKIIKNIGNQGREFGKLIKKTLAKQRI